MTISFIQHACDVMQRSARRLLKEYERKTGVRLSGPLRFTTQRDPRYAWVENNPDYVLTAPDSSWRGFPQRYNVWVGEEEIDTRRMLRVFQFLIAHEAMHVIWKVTGFHGLPVMPLMAYHVPGVLQSWQIVMFFDLKSATVSQELLYDRGACELNSTRRKAALFSMLGYSKLFLEEYRQEKLTNFTLSLAARELAKIRWVEGNEMLPGQLRRRAERLRKDYFALLTARDRSWKTKEDKFLRLLEVYLQIFSHAKIDLQAAEPLKSL